MDITFRSEDGVFNYRVCAVIVHNDHILAMQDGRSPYIIFQAGVCKCMKPLKPPYCVN